jgi:two-component system, cell cycle response regulator
MMTSESGLRAENQALRRQLENLLHEARQNEEKMRRFDRLERLLIGAGSLQELVRVLLDEYQQAFALDSVSLALLDRDGEAASILERVTDSGNSLGGLTLLPSAEPLEALYGDACQPYLGAFAAHHAPYFDSPTGHIASVALLPLMRQGELIGSLHFGSADPQRYGPGCATDLLERLAAVIAICLESALTQERLKLAGLTDALTGAHNRRYFEHRCQVEISQARRYQHPLCCMFIDIDHFKRINDRHGHPTGDDVLCRVAQAIQAQLRAGDTIARYGGEEFVVLLPQLGEQHALQIAERIRCCIAVLPLQARSGETISLSISLGLSTLPADDPVGTHPSNQQLAERLIGAADQALYRAKKGGRNRVECAQSLALSPEKAPRGWRTPRNWPLLAKKR